VAAGASWWDESATGEIRASMEESQSQVATNLTKTPHLLTGTELEILSLLAEGKTNQEIASALYISPGTVRVHVHTILHKLEVSDRHQAVVVALHKQLIKSSKL